MPRFSHFVIVSQTVGNEQSSNLFGKNIRLYRVQLNAG